MNDAVTVHDLILSRDGLLEEIYQLRKEVSSLKQERDFEKELNIRLMEGAKT
jgi:hypothetical protein